MTDFDFFPLKIFKISPETSEFSEFQNCSNLNRAFCAFPVKMFRKSLHQMYTAFEEKKNSRLQKIIILCRETEKN